MSRNPVETRDWRKPRRGSDGQEFMVPLHPKEKAFILAYLRTLDVEKSAIAAGYTSRHPDGPYMRGHFLMGLPYIRKIISEVQGKALLVETDIVERLNEMATINVDYFFTTVYDAILPDGTVPSHKEIDWEAVHKKGFLIKELVIDRGKTTIKLYDAKDALELLGKHRHLWSDQMALKDLGDVIVKIVKGVTMEDI